jgi:hypothetical protein
MLNFEEEWRKKMLNASVAPSENVWEGIALHLSQKKKKTYHQKWIAGWIAVLLPFIVGDGNLQYFYEGKSVQANHLHFKRQDLQESGRNYLFVKNEKPPIHRPIQDIPDDQRLNLVAEANYESETEKVASKRSIEPNPLELEKVGKPKRRRWWIQNQLGVEQTYRNIHFTPQNLYSFSRALSATPVCSEADKRVQDELNSLKPILSYRIGVEMGFQLNQHWFIASGVHLSRSMFSLEVNPNNIYPEMAKFYGKVTTTAPPPIATSSPHDPLLLEQIPESLDNAQPATQTNAPSQNFIQQMDYVSIPVKIGYQKQAGRMRYAMATGVEGSYLLNNSFISKQNTIHQVTDYMNRLQMAAVADISVGYVVSGKTLLQISPSFRKAVNSPLAQDSPLKQKGSISLGVNMGMLYRF